jgi:gentisate 1,2-dioxygenase
MALMGPQRQATPATAAQARGRYFNSANAFNIRLPEVPPHSFADEAARAMAPGTPTGTIDCDQSAALGSERPATTPLMLARYARIAAGETLDAHFTASGTIGYVIAGAGRTDIAATEAGPPAERIDWSAGDVIFFPGGAHALHRAGDEAAVLWLVNDEPLMAFGELRAAARPSSPAVHYPAAEIRHQLAQLYDAEPEPTTSGRALIFSSDTLEHTHNIHPFLTLSLNTLPPGESQSAHRHNSAAITLIVDGDDCHSMVDGQAGHWQRWSTMVTPPGAAHSHHNGGGKRALFLIVQDGGLHYRARTMGFTALPSAA